MQLRSGADFAPYYQKRVFHFQSTSENPISTRIDVEPLIQSATAQEDARFERGEGDSEGLGVSSRSASPLTDLDSDSEAGVSGDSCRPCPSSELQSGPKKRRTGASRRRAKKRVKLATSGHKPHTYAARSSTALYRAEEMEPLRVPEDAKYFPASESGSWVGLRKSGVKKKPWSVSDLVENGFTFIEWDGQ